MGCWDETCGLSLQPIRANDPAVMVWLDPDEGIGLRTVEPSHVFGNPFDLKAIKEIHKGTYNNYGFLEEVPEEKPKGSCHDRRMWSKEGKEQFLIFFHRKIWEEVVAFENKADNHLDAIIKSLYQTAILNHSPKFFDEFLKIVVFAHKTRRDLLSAVRWRGSQDWDADKRRNLLLKLTLQHQAEWRYQETSDDALLDEYGRYYLEDEDDPTSKVPPENPTLSERIADVLRTEDEYGWREALSIHGHTVFSLLREAQTVLRAIET